MSRTVIIYRQNVEAAINAGKAAAPKRDVARVLHRNPDRWAGEVEPCDVCVVVGEYPKLVEAYEDADVEVKVVKKPGPKEEVDDVRDEETEEKDAPEEEAGQASPDDGVVVGE